MKDEKEPATQKGVRVLQAEGAAQTKVLRQERGRLFEEPQEVQCDEHSEQGREQGEFGVVEKQADPAGPSSASVVSSPKAATNRSPSSTHGFIQKPPSFPTLLAGLPHTEALLPCAFGGLPGPQNRPSPGEVSPPPLISIWQVRGDTVRWSKGLKMGRLLSLPPRHSHTGGLDGALPSIQLTNSYKSLMQETQKLQLEKLQVKDRGQI